jgi:hypothetical protein
MSLEVAIQENTAALRELIARLTSGSQTAVTMTGAEYVEKLDKPAADTKAKEGKTEPWPFPNAKPGSPGDKINKAQADAKAKTEAPTLDYVKDVKPLLLKVSASKGRDALVSLLNEFGVDKGDKLPADKLPEVVAQVNELLAA